LRLPTTVAVVEAALRIFKLELTVTIQP
jgi:hypothetical protein